VADRIEATTRTLASVSSCSEPKRRWCLCFQTANQTLSATAFKSPAIALSGVVDYEMYTKFRTQFDSASDQEIVVIELSTLGGDPEVARMMGEDVRFGRGEARRLPLDYLIGICAERLAAGSASVRRNSAYDGGRHGDQAYYR
jgi:hypothetical protein